jgi:hypothetical protein
MTVRSFPTSECTPKLRMIGLHEDDRFQILPRDGIA